MNAEYSITFRLPKKYAAVAEEFLVESGEKNFNALAQKLLIAEIEKRQSRSENLLSRFDGENVEFLLAALGNSRELFLRVFEILFAGSEAKERFEDIAEELQNDWSAINQMFSKRTSAPDEIADNFAADIETEINEIFDVKLIESVPANFVSAAVVDSENSSPKILKQVSLFD